MFTEEMLRAVAGYEANLHLDGEGDAAPSGGTDEPGRHDRRVATATTAATTTTTEEP